uniref:Uncharacterized protein n=1 Tax=Kalanchoe fedtschenkoi TaxID=63787 RepID=A0A7N0ZY00_KALFE
MSRQLFEMLKLAQRAVQTQDSTVTNYDVHSPTSGDVRQAHPLSAMKTACPVPGLHDHRSDPVQVSGDSLSITKIDQT